MNCLLLRSVNAESLFIVKNGILDYRRLNGYMDQKAIATCL